MFPRIRWRIITTYLTFILLTMGGMSFYILRPLCVVNLQCILQTLIVSSLIMISGVIVIGYVVASRTVRPIQQLTEVIRRISSGDNTARILPRTRDEVGTLIRVYNSMTNQLQIQIADLSKKYHRLATAVQNMADGVIITDGTGYVILINPAAMRLLNTTEANAINRSFAEVVRHHQLIEIWQRCEKSGKDEIGAVEIGSNLFLQTFVTPFPQRDTRGFLVVIQDLTTIRKLQTVRRDFISNVSHELRTPLTSIRAVVETLQSGALADSSMAHRFLQRAEQEIDVMTQIVEELMELSRIESGQVPLKLTATKVSDLLLIPVERLRGQAQRGNIDITLDLPIGLPMVLADADRVRQVVINLLHNAIKFTPENGQITISAKDNDDPEASGTVVFMIKDTGSGIMQDDLPRIFERFYKSDRARTRGQTGTGLGLAISSHIVQAHNGRIWVKSKEKKGSTFFFTLPKAL